MTHGRTQWVEWHLEYAQRKADFQQVGHMAVGQIPAPESLDAGAAVQLAHAFVTCSSWVSCHSVTSYIMSIATGCYMANTGM